MTILGCMNTPSSHIPENTFGIESIGNSVLSAGVISSTSEQTSNVLDFASRRLMKQAATINPTPLIVQPKNTPIATKEAMLPENLTGVFPDFVKHIASKADSIDTLDPEFIKEFQSMLHSAAEIDAQAGRFGTSGLHVYPSFSDVFKRSLRPAVRELIPDDETLLREVNVNIGAIFNNAIQEKLLTMYGEILKNKDSYENPEQLEERLSQIKTFKKSWKVGGLDWAMPNENRESKGGRNAFNIIEGSIPAKFETIFTFLFETFVEHYVEKVWETEGLLRHPAAEAIKSA